MFVVLYYLQYKVQFSGKTWTSGGLSVDCPIRYLSPWYTSHTWLALPLSTSSSSPVPVQVLTAHSSSHRCVFACLVWVHRLIFQEWYTVLVISHTRLYMYAGHGSLSSPDKESAVFQLLPAPPSCGAHCSHPSLPLDIPSLWSWSPPLQFDISQLNIIYM